MSLKYEVTRYSRSGIFYYCHGLLHRINGPSLITNDKDMHWCQYGTSHRMDGPAIIFRGIMSWRKYYIHGVEYTKNAFKRYIVRHNTALKNHKNVL